MPDVTASRTLVKSHPELWTECSDAGSLSRHLGRFGEIRITRLEPETAVAWEGEHVSGTVRLEPSGWGTRVVLTATPAPPEDVPAPPPPAVAESPEEPQSVGDVPDEPAALEPAAQPVVAREEADAPVPVAPRRGLLSRLLGMFHRDRAPAPAVGRVETEPEPAVGRVETEPEPAVARAADGPEALAGNEAPDAGDQAAAQALREALDSLGKAHHRPFSRS